MSGMDTDRFISASYVLVLFSSLTFLSAFFLTSSIASADDSIVDQINVTVPVSCSMEGVGMNSHIEEIVNGAYQDNIGTTTLKTYCNDRNGFSIYAIGYTNDTYGITTLIGQSTNNTIATGTATSAGSSDISNWAMKLTAVSSPTPTYPIILDNGYGNYSLVPSAYTKVAHRDSGTDIGVAAEGSTLTTTYAAYISRTQPADTYIGKVKYTLVHPASEIPLQPQTAASGCINYFSNGSNVEGTMGCQSISSSATSATLLASNFSRIGYGFAGWSDAFDYATNANAHFYGPQEDITFTAGQYTGTNDGLALYAVWVKSQGSIQDSSKVTSVCNALTTAPTDGTANLASVSALTDQRDNQTYAIAKLADDKCWMIENLRLESTNSDNSTGALAQGYGTSTTYGNFSGLATTESTNFSNSTTFNSLYYSGTQGGTASIDIGTTNYPGYRMPRYNNTNISSRASSPTTNNTSMYSYGNYYTWHAAIADTTYYSSGNHDNTSLCPTGWKLPIGNQSTAANSFGALSVALGGPAGGATADSSSIPTGAVMSKTFRTYPNNFIYSGYYPTSSASNRGSYGIYWSSATRNYGTSYVLYLDNALMNPGTNYGNKFNGRSIRCTAPVST